MTLTHSQHDLLKFLAESAQELAVAVRDASLRQGLVAEAEELMSLRAKLLARHQAVQEFQLQLPFESKIAA